MAVKPSKKVIVKTKAPTYSAVRLSMVVMTAVAMVSAGVIGGALLVAALPKTQIIKNVTPLAAKSANGAVLGEVLVRFKAGTTGLARVQAVKTALATAVNVTTLQNVKKRVGLRTVTQTVETVTKKVPTYKSLTPVLDSKITLTSLAFDQRAKRGTAADVQATAKVLSQWYVLRIDPPTADLNQIITLLGKQASIEKAETNRYVQAAANPGVASSASGAVIKLTDAQDAAYVAAGDCNVDKAVDGKDLRILINYMFNNGPQPKSLAAADVNRDGSIDLADVTALVSSLYASATTGYADLTGDGQYTSDDVNFLTAYLYSGGKAPSPLSIADYDKDGSVDIADLTMAVNAVYTSAGAALNYGRGDANADGKVDQRDVDFVIAYLFSGGPAPSPLGLADMDLDGTVDIADLTILISTLYKDVGGVQAAAIAPTANVSETTESTSQPVTPPAFLLADSNADGRVTNADIDHLVAYLFSGGPAPSPLGRDDLDVDGSVDIADLTAMIDMLFAQFRTRVQAADLNVDGVVNVADVTYLVNYLFNQGPAPDLTKADVDGDGSVDIADLTVLVTYVYQSQSAPVCADVRTVSATTFLTGDVDGNGSVTDADLSQLAKIVYAKAPSANPVERGDVNCDAVVSAMDVMVLNEKLKRDTTFTTLPGDANGDGLVDPKDILVSVKTPTDINGDGVANIRDTFDLVRLLKLHKATKALPDLNGDGKVNWVDADVLVAGVWQTGTLSATADVNGDGTADAADAYAFISSLQAQQTVTSVLAGDANADSLVDCRDVKFLHAGFFTKGPKPSPAARGDVNADGTANVADALLLAKRACPAIGEGAIARDVKVALLDSGVSNAQAVVQATLAQSKERAINKKDDDGNGYIDDIVGLNVINASPVTVDCNGHGTALARMLTTKTGVASRSQVIPVKVLDCKGRGFVTGVANGLVYATVRGADIAELPFSGYGTSALLADVVKYAKASGLFVVAAAGNDGTAMSRVMPANVAGVFSVAATTANGASLTSYSNTGASIAAPGNATGVVLQGTSLSATYVTGTAALALAKNPNLTLAELTSKLTPKVTINNPKAVKLLDASSATAQ
ncbi:MAG: dockerin type I domain-containing protein [Patescibacteria group bacterium]